MGAHCQRVGLTDAAALRLTSGKALLDVLRGELSQIPCEKCKVLLGIGLTIPFPLVYKANGSRLAPRSHRGKVRTPLCGVEASQEILVTGQKHSSDQCHFVD